LGQTHRFDVRDSTLNSTPTRADGEKVSQLPSRDDLMRRREVEQGDIDRPRMLAETAERVRTDGVATCWELLEEFVGRVQELGIEPRRWEPETSGPYTPRITWAEGYPLTNGSVVSVPPMRYCAAERRAVRKPRLEVHEVEELSHFAMSGDPALAAVGFVEHSTRTSGPWPRIDRAEYAAVMTRALRSELENSLFVLMG